MDNKKRLNQTAIKRLNDYFLPSFDEAFNGNPDSIGLDEHTAMDMLGRLIDNYDQEVDGYDSVYQQFDKQDLEAVRLYLMGRSAADSSRRLRTSDGDLRRAYDTSKFRQLSRKLGETCGIMYALNGSIDANDTPENITATTSIGHRLDELRGANIEEGYVRGMQLLFGQAEVPAGKEEVAKMVVSVTRDRLLAKIKTSRGNIADYKTLLSLTGSRADSIRPRTIDEVVAIKAKQMVGDSSNTNMKAAKQQVLSDISNELGILYRRELDR